MDLRGTYLKYTPEITEEVFGRIIKKIEELGFSEFAKSNGYCNFLRDRYLQLDNGQAWYVYAEHDGKKPITVTDILGDGWDKQDTQPTKWSVGSWVVALKDGAISIGEWKKGDIAEVSAPGKIEVKGDPSWRCSSFSEDEGEVKWFPTKQQALDFAATLKQPKTQLTVDDLVAGEYYYGDDWIFIYKGYDPYVYAPALRVDRNCFNETAGIKSSHKKVKRLATPQERHWLDVCIAAGMFVSKDEAMKTFNQQPEVEWWKTLKKGDCVVCVETAARCNVDMIYEVKRTDDDGWISHSQLNSEDNGHKYTFYRPATPQETALYRAYGKPVHINTPMPKESASTPVKTHSNDTYAGRCVHVTTQQQWDFVSDKLNYEWKSGTWSKYGGETCINIMFKWFCDVAYFRGANHQVLSFDEWLYEFNHYGDWCAIMEQTNPMWFAGSDPYAIDAIRASYGAAISKHDLLKRYPLTPEEAFNPQQHMIGDFEPIKINTQKEVNINIKF